MIQGKHRDDLAARGDISFAALARAADRAPVRLSAAVEKSRCPRDRQHERDAGDANRKTEKHLSHHTLFSHINMATKSEARLSLT
jgi:hypothetical protein